MFKNHIKEDFCYFRGGNGSVSGVEVRSFSIAVNKNYYGVMAFCVVGSWTMKSMVTCAHRSAGISNGWSNPAGCWFEFLLCWHLSQEVTNFLTSFAIFGQ